MATAGRRRICRSSVRIVERMRTQCTARQWGEWLSVLLKHAVAGGDKELAEELVLAAAHRDPLSEAIRAEQHIIELLRLAPHEGHLRLALKLGSGHGIFAAGLGC